MKIYCIKVEFYLNDDEDEILGGYLYLFSEKEKSFNFIQDIEYDYDSMKPEEFWEKYKMNGYRPDIEDDAIYMDIHEEEYEVDEFVFPRKG